MMQLTDEEQAFIDRRTVLLRTWPMTGILLLLMTIGLGVWLVVTNPLLANPWVVWHRLRQDAIPPESLALMAAILPVVSLMCMAILLAMVLLAWWAMCNEKRWQRIIEREFKSADNPNFCNDSGTSHKR